MKKCIILLCVCLSMLNLLYAQNMTQQLYWKTPLSRNGVTNVTVDLTYKIVNAMGEIQIIGDAICSGSRYAFNYKGREFYVENTSGVRIYDPIIEMTVQGPNGFSKTCVLWITTGMGGGSLFGNSVGIKTATTDEERNPANYRVISFRVKDLSFSDYSYITQQLDEKIKNEQRDIEVKNLMETAKNAEYKKDWAAAVDAYEEVLRLDPENKIATEKIKKARDEAAKKEAKTKAEDLIKKARQAEAEGRTDDAIQHFEEAASADPNNTLPKNEANRLREKQRKENEAKKVQEEKDLQARKDKEEQEKKSSEAAEAEKKESAASEPTENKPEEKSTSTAPSEQKKEERTYTEYELEQFRKSMVASQLEKEGDVLYGYGTMYYASALQKYKEAYAQFPSDRLRSKINELETLIGAAVLIDQTMTVISDKVSDRVHEIDPTRSTDFSYGFFQYTGLPFKRNYENVFNQEARPSDFWFGITGQRLGMSLQIRGGIMQTDYFELNVERSGGMIGGDWENVSDKVLIRNTGAGFGLSAGFNLPLFRNKSHIFLLYGIDIRLDFKTSIYSPLYKLALENSAKTPMIGRRLEFGYNWNIPNTNMGLGVHMTTIAFKGKEIDDLDKKGLELINENNNSGDWKYRMESYTFDKQRFFSLGVKVFWFLG